MQVARHQFLQATRTTYGKFTPKNEIGLLYFISYDKGQFLKQNNMDKALCLLRDLDCYTSKKEENTFLMQPQHFRITKAVEIQIH